MAGNYVREMNLWVSGKRIELGKYGSCLICSQSVVIFSAIFYMCYSCMSNMGTLIHDETFHYECLCIKYDELLKQVVCNKAVIITSFMYTQYIFSSFLLYSTYEKCVK